jgi:hypothetical protein
MNGIRSVRTRNTVLRIEEDTGSIRIRDILLDGKSRGLHSPLSLPQAYERDGAQVPFRWELIRSEDREDGFSLMFSDEGACCAVRMDLFGTAALDGPVELSGALYNLGPKEIRVIPGELYGFRFAFSRPPVCWRFPKESGVAEGVRWHQNPKIFFPGPGIRKTELPEGAECVCAANTNQDFNQGGFIPMVYLDGGTAGAYLAMEWPSCRIVCRGEKEGVRVSADLGGEFSTRIPPGGDLFLPPVYVGVYDGDVDDGSNLFKRWFFSVKSPRYLRDDPAEPFIQIDAQLSPARAKELGIESVKWDYGWWSREKVDGNPDTFWKSYEGSWKYRLDPNLDEAASDALMKRVGAEMREAGVNWTVYVLLHDSLRPLSGDDELTSVGPGGHPEWFTDRRIAGICPTADLGNEDCVAYLKRKMPQFFLRYGIGTWRSDFEPIACRSDKKNRHDANGSDVQYWCSRGFFEVTDHLLRTVPGFRYESCSSGGSMKDFAVFRRATVFNNDDSADWMSLRTTFYDSSYCFPPAQLQAPCNPDTFCPDCEKHYAGLGGKDDGMRAMLMGAVMFGSWCGPSGGHLPHGLEAYYETYVSLYKEKIRPLVRDANLYHVLPRPDHIHWDGVQYGRSDRPENGIAGVLFLFKPTADNPPAIRVPVRGLEPSSEYRAAFHERKEQSFTARGEDLMRDGIVCRIDEDSGSELVFFELI